MSETLKPCPFCGSDDVLHGQGDFNDLVSPTMFVECLECGVTGPWCYTAWEAAEAWNRRVFTVAWEGREPDVVCSSCNFVYEVGSGEPWPKHVCGKSEV